MNPLFNLGCFSFSNSLIVSFSEKDPTRFFHQNYQKFYILKVFVNFKPIKNHIS
jgi:hypothetical protein